MSNYTVTVMRGPLDGVLQYNGKLTVSSTCWWDLNAEIPIGTYRRCSATTMSTKTNSKGQPREAIFIPNVSGFSGIFIHMGYSSSWSDGCIVIPEDKMIQIYNDIEPKNAHNVTVVVRDR